MKRKSASHIIIFPVFLFAMGGYFAFAAVQGEFGVLRQVEMQAQRDVLVAELALLDLQTERMRDRTRRMSDDYLDLDLLDEQARAVLGMARSDEIVVQ